MHLCSVHNVFFVGMYRAVYVKCLQTKVAILTGFVCKTCSLGEALLPVMFANIVLSSKMFANTQKKVALSKD